MGEGTVVAAVGAGSRGQEKADGRITRITRPRREEGSGEVISLREV